MKGQYGYLEIVEHCEMTVWQHVFRRGQYDKYRKGFVVDRSVVKKQFITGPSVKLKFVSEQKDMNAITQ